MNTPALARVLDAGLTAVRGLHRWLLTGRVPSQEWAAGFNAGRRSHLWEITQFVTLAEQLRQAMNAAMRDEYGEDAEQIGPFGEANSDDHIRLMRIAVNLAQVLAERHRDGAAVTAPMVET